MTDVLTSPQALDDIPATIAALHQALDHRLDRLFAGETERWIDVDPSLLEPLDVLRSFVASGGKRIRPSFCFLGHLGAGGAADDERVVELAAAIELLHAFALIHDDVMDGSAVRRHAPSVHERFAAVHAEGLWAGERRRYGEGMAVLVGDLAFVYSTACTNTLPLPVRAIFDEMRIELHMGQYLDLRSAATRESDASRARTIMQYKSGAYSVQRPLQLGATLAAGPCERTAAVLGEFGLAVGEAFQLRDDLLGATGDPSVTGKPRGDDFREGKRTTLVVAAEHWAIRHGSSEDRALLARLGSPDLTPQEITAFEALLVSAGVTEASEQRITSLMSTADLALDRLGFAADVSTALGALAARCAWRAA